MSGSSFPAPASLAARGAYKGRKPPLSAGQAENLRVSAAAGEPKAGLAWELGISRQTLYQHLSPPVPGVLGDPAVGRVP